MTKRQVLTLAAVVSACLATYAPALHAEANVRSAIRIAAVGDMACDSHDPHFFGGKGTSTHCKEMRVSSRIKNAVNPWTAVLGLGDFQYDCGAPNDYRNSYDPSFGRLDDLMWPTPGNHEYKTGMDAYGVDCPSGNDHARVYFNRLPRSHPTTKGHYSFNFGSWHFVSLNANCDRVGGCAATDAETDWLRSNLRDNTQRCIAAFWHQPLYTGVSSGINSTYREWWKVLIRHHADLVLNGHIHNYQRFAPMDESGHRTRSGITEYIVGTGGESQVRVQDSASPQPVAWKNAFGYLRLRLTSDGWRSRFITIGGRVFDKHQGHCH